MAIFSENKLESMQSREKQQKKHRILIVDDEEDNLNALSSVLAYSYDVLRAANGTEACELIEGLDDDQQLSMVISDQRMPQMTGVELFEHLSHIKPEPIRIILTGYTDVKAIIAAINKGQVYHFLLKPYERVEFLMVVKQGLKTFELKQSSKAAQDELKQQLAGCAANLNNKERQLDEAFRQLKSAGLEHTAQRIRLM
ncbi:MAG: response regulator RpfG family c-di-GMP phosphodiesterase [Phenylobacterium sp.]|jgi:response regulator RpfG family c-di-GMP phosphodiesterase